MLLSWRQSTRDALDLGRRPIELAGLRLSPSEARICKEVTRELKERRIVGLQAYARPQPKHQLRYRLPAFEQRKDWASRHVLLPRLGGTAAHLRYFRQATELPHPLGVRPTALPADLQAAVAYVSGRAGGVVADRVKRLEWLSASAERLRPLNDRLLALMPPHVRAAAGGMQLALVSCMIDALPGYPDRFLVRRFVQGFHVVGQMEDSGLFRLIPEELREQASSAEEVFSQESNIAWVDELERTMSAKGNGPGVAPSNAAIAAYEATLKECQLPDVTTWGKKLEPEEAARTGSTHRGLSRDEVDKHPWLQLRVHGVSARGLWRPIRRFAIWQKGKWRPCDHARES